jgi:hypothetical protein
MPEDKGFKYMLVCVDLYDGTVDAEPIKEVIKDISREEMVQQADKIGLVIDKRWKDSTLLNRINETMGV